MSSTHPEHHCLTSFYRNTSNNTLSDASFFVTASATLSPDVLSGFCEAKKVSPLALLAGVTGLYFARINEAQAVSIGCVLPGSPTPERVIPLACRLDAKLTFATMVSELELQLNSSPTGAVVQSAKSTSFEIMCQLSDVVNSDNSDPDNKSPLTVCLTGADHFPQLSLSADAAYFNEAEATLLADRLMFLLAQGWADSDQCVAQMALLPSAELENLASYQQGADWPYPQTTLHQLFEQQVEKTPDNVALQFDGLSLSYHQLNQRVNRLALVIQNDYLTDGTAEPLIALYLERSVEMVVAILAVLKAGGAYVPVSPDYPKARTQFILADTATPLVLRQACFKSLLDD